MRVKLRATGEVVEIEESEFDETLHERIEATPASERTVGSMTGQEFELLVGGAFAESTRNLLNDLGAGRVDRSALATAPQPATVPARAALRAVPAWERQYELLPDWERKFRTPESDVAVWRYFGALLNKDHATLREVLMADPVHGAALKAGGARALAEGTAAAGGALVPSPLADLIVVKRDKRERIAPRAMRLTTNADTLTVPAEATVGAVAGVAEAGTIGETDSTFAEVTLRKKKAGRRVRSSRELLFDISAAFSLVTILSDQAARKLAVYMDTQEATGNGTGTQHTDGLANNGSIAAITGTSGSITRAKVVKLFYGLPSEWREGGGAVFMGNAAVIELIGGLVDSTGRPIYDTQVAAARPVSDVGSNVVNMVEGLPLIEVPFATNILMVGLLAEGFAVLMDSGVRVEATMEGDTAFETDSVVWKFVERRDSAVLLADAFKKSDGALTA